MKRVWKFLTSLRLTAVLLALGIILVFVGTVAQADEGLYQAQSRYFKHWYVFGISFWGKELPIPLPGGYLLGTALLINLLAAHIARFQWTWKKLGIHLTHAGVILLLVGQLVTDIFSYETQLSFVEGETKSYSISPRDFELAFVTDAGNGTEDVVVVPQTLLAHSVKLEDSRLPVLVHVKSFWHNSEVAFRAPMSQTSTALTPNGVAASFDFKSAPDVRTMDDKDVPTAVLEFFGHDGSSLGTWVASGWAGGEDLSSVARVFKMYAPMVGRDMADSILGRLAGSQSIKVGGKTYSFALRPVRIYKPFSLTLLNATHTTYAGRPDLPKDFRSRVRIDNPQTSEKREVEIYMNTPLRYSGLTFYQFQMAAGEEVQQAGQAASSTLQVVRNPSWLTPYAGCGLVALGLLVQFGIHLVGFIIKRTSA